MESVEIYKILRQFHQISGFRVSIHDTEFNEIYAYPGKHTLFCRNIQQSIGELKLCRQNDADAFLRVKQTGEAFVYKCRHGLCEAVAPVYHYGVLSGYLMMGQVCVSGEDSTERIRDKVLKLFKAEEDTDKIINSIKTVPEERIEAYLGLMTVIAEYITETNRLYPKTKNLAQLVAEYADKNYSSKITLEALMQKFHCSKSTITKSFRDEYGMSVISYLTNTRLKNAVKLMETSEMSIKEIASECGFYDQNYFSRVFSDAFGVSPTKYRKNKKK